MKVVKHAVKFFFIYFSLITSSFCVNPSDFINSISSEASEILTSKLSDSEKVTKLKMIAEESVDINGVGLYTLGKHRKTLSNEQREEYKKLFKEYFLKSFSGRLVVYNDAKIAVLSEEVKNEKYTIVYSKLIGTTDRPEVKIDWRVYTKNPEKPLIRDLVIEGLSLARTQKEEFNSIIENNGGDISALFANLRKFLDK